jgi:hypothetical protein
MAAVRLAPADAWAVAEALAEEVEVMWVEPHPLYRVNNADSAAVIMSGSTNLDGVTGTPIGTTPVWDAGIHGEDEIVGVGDSGLDVGHCFFEDN